MKVFRFCPESLFHDKKRVFQNTRPLPAGMQKPKGFRLGIKKIDRHTVSHGQTEDTARILRYKPVCAACGEKVMETRARLRRGRVLCGPCVRREVPKG